MGSVRRRRGALLPLLAATGCDSVPHPPAFGPYWRSTSFSDTGNRSPRRGIDPNREIRGKAVASAPVRKSQMSSRSVLSMLVT
jgi:hypothetical protein